MGGCCSDKACELELFRKRQSRVLQIVLGINATMFAAESISGWLAGSVALLADSLDMLGDSLIYAFSLFVVGRGALWEARAARAKAVVMAGFGIAVFAQLVYRALSPTPPTVEIIGVVGFLALVANAACFFLLWRYRAQGINMRSVWLCSRNDLVANVMVLAAAAAVWSTRSPWPDLIVGAALCALFGVSARSVWLDAREAKAAVRGPATNDVASRPLTTTT